MVYISLLKYFLFSLLTNTQYETNIFIDPEKRIGPGSDCRVFFRGANAPVMLKKQQQ